MPEINVWDIVFFVQGWIMGSLMGSQIAHLQRLRRLHMLLWKTPSK